MTKEVRRELRELKLKLRQTVGEYHRSMAACRGADRRNDKKLNRVVNPAKREHAQEQRAIQRERAAACKLVTRSEKAISDRIAVLEGRMAS